MDPENRAGDDGVTRDETSPDVAEDDAGVEPAHRDEAARGALARARQAARQRGLRPGSRTRGRRATEARGGSGEPYTSGRDPVSVGATVERILTDRGWERPLSVAGVIGRWASVVGEQLADHCQPETFEDGALVVRADSTAWAMQVRLLLPQLERRLEEEVGEGVVDSITVLGPAGPTWKKGSRSVQGRGPRDTYG